MGWLSSPPTKTQLDAAHVRRLLRILFIDDESMGMAEALRGNGYNTFQKYDVEDLSELEKQEYHLIFCDIRGVGSKLSDDEGAGLIRLIKNQIRYPVVIAYSAEAYQPGSEHESTMRTVADDVIRKDASLEDYLNLVQRWGQAVFSSERCVELLATTAGMSRKDSQTTVQSILKKGKSAPQWDDVVKAGGAVKTVVEIIALLHGLG